MKTRRLGWTLCLLAVAGCHRAAPAVAEVGDALRTTDGVLAMANLDALIDGREAFVERDSGGASQRAVLVDLLQTRGQLLGRLADYDRAQHVAQTAVAVAPQLPESWLARASNALTFHQFQDALGDLDEAARRGADKDGVEALRASALLAEGRTDEALALRRHAVQRWANTATLTSLAVAEVAAGDLAQADAHLDAAVRAYHDVAPFPLAFVDFQRALLAEEEGNLDRAAARYRAVLRRLPRHVQAAVHLSALELARGHVEAAASVLAPLGPLDDPEVLALQADVLERQGQRAEADGLRQRVDARYRVLVARHPEAFADHAARFLLTRDAPRALALARLNLAARQTSAAYDLALSAALAAGDEAVRCEIARGARGLPHPPPRLTALAQNGLAGCASAVLPGVAGALAP
ncbi:MAG: tetratricopeptide repeat protein [Myxococcaceae bacterium]